jgi:5-methylcytosine-specific restriction endonuclease McrA
MPCKDKEKASAYQNKWMQNRRRKWIAANGPCVRCKSSEDLQVDHIDHTKKTSHRIWSWSKKKLEAELSKCRVLCKKCHRKKTTLERGQKPARHGSKVMYNYGCRCDECREANSKACRAYRARKAEREGQK